MIEYANGSADIENIISGGNVQEYIQNDGEEKTKQKKPVPFIPSQFDSPKKELKKKICNDRSSSSTINMPCAFLSSFAYTSDSAI